MEVMPSFLAGDLIRVVLRCRKNPMPSPVFTRIRIFSFKRIRESYATQTVRQVLLVLAFGPLKVFQKRFFDSGRKHRVAIFVALASANDNLVPGKVNVLDPKTATLHQPQSSSIEKQRHQPWSARHATENPFHFLFCKHDGQSSGSFGPNDS